jgi:hypothetical protein
MVTAASDESSNRAGEAPMYAPRAATENGRPGHAAGLTLDEVIAALRSLQAQYNSLRVAEQILLHIMDAKENIAALERRKLSLLDEIGKLEQRREDALANAAAAEQAAKVRLESLESQIRKEEERLASERKRLEEDLQYLRTVVNKLTHTASELKL